MEDVNRESLEVESLCSFLAKHGTIGDLGSMTLLLLMAIVAESIAENGWRSVRRNFERAKRLTCDQDPLIFFTPLRKPRVYQLLDQVGHVADEYLIVLPALGDEKTCTSRAGLKGT